MLVPKKSHLLAFTLILSLATLGLAAGAETPKVKEIIDVEDVELRADSAPEKLISTDKFDRGSPRSSMRALSEALIERDYTLALKYLDMRNVPVSMRDKPLEIARKLRIIAERSFWVDIDTISNEPQGHTDDGLPDNNDIIAQLKTPEGLVSIVMQRSTAEDSNLIWRLSNKTVAEIPQLYDHYGYGKYGDALSGLLPEYEIFGMEVWQWVMLIIIIVPAFFLSSLVAYSGQWLVGKFKAPPHHRINRFISRPVRFAVFVLIVRANLDLVSPTFSVQAIFEAQTFLIVAAVWLLIGAVDVGFSRLSDQMRARDDQHATVLLKPAATLVKVVIWVIAIVTWLDNLGFNVTTILAGLGIGGIAVGLAAQKSIENLIGAITLYAAEPIRIGDFCKAGDTLGVIEEIGLRFTTLRTLDRTMVTIPNANLANMNIENYTRRDKFLHRRTLQLRNDTTPDQVNRVLRDIRELLSTHAEVDAVPARVCFTEYGEFSLNLDVFAYIKTKDINKYLEVVEDLNLRILDIVSAAGTQLAVPARRVKFEGVEQDEYATALAR